MEGRVSDPDDARARKGAAVTPREHAAESVPHLWGLRGEPYDELNTSAVEAAIRAAAAPLVEALRRIATIDYREEHGSDFACALGEAQERAAGALAVWDAK